MAIARKDLESLLNKVDSVIANHDWPTEEGARTEDRSGPLEQLVDRIRNDMGRKA